MIRLLKALLFAGLFFANYSQAETTGACTVGTPLNDVGCVVPAPNKGVWTAKRDNTLTGSGPDPQSALASLAGNHAALTTTCQGGSGTQTFAVLSVSQANGPYSGGYYMGAYEIEATCTWTTYNVYIKENVTNVSKTKMSMTGVSITSSQAPSCPPDNPLHKEFRTLHTTNTTPATHYCVKPFDPLDCSALQGMASSMLYDKYLVNVSAGYTYQKPPSCVTRCAVGEDGLNRCGDCKVIAPSWSRQPVDNQGNEKWWPNAGTFTGDACGATEKEVPPPESPKCWETKNGLNMCVQDPAEKCVVVNGVQKCEAGCGTINDVFFCADKDTTPKVDPNSKDKPIPEPDDNITDPTKSINDMQKQDFKDVQKGVESRIVGVGAAVGNVENSVDSVNESIKDLIEIQEDSLEQAQSQTDQLGQINDKLNGIGSGGGSGGGDGDGEGSGADCDPNSNPDCVADAGVNSWWNSAYPEGLNGVFQEKMNDFQNSESYQALTQPLTLNNSGARPAWNFCFNFGFADFGCEELSVPDFIWHFIKACMLFGAAILCRRLLIGG